jgi:hypothetical protein
MSVGEAVWLTIAGKGCQVLGNCYTKGLPTACSLPVKVAAELASCSAGYWHQLRVAGYGCLLCRQLVTIV